MIQSLMALARRERVVVIGAAILLLLAGLYSFTQLDIEAYTDPVQPMTEILTLPSGYSAKVERLVTIPTEYAMSGMLRLKSMESISLYGLSDIRRYFDWKATTNSTAPGNHQSTAIRHVPQGIMPGLSPENPIRQDSIGLPPNSRQS